MPSWTRFLYHAHKVFRWCTSIAIYHALYRRILYCKNVSILKEWTFMLQLKWRHGQGFSTFTRIAIYHALYRGILYSKNVSFLQEWTFKLQLQWRYHRSFSIGSWDGRSIPRASPDWIKIGRLKIGYKPYRSHLSTFITTVGLQSDLQVYV